MAKFSILGKTVLMRPPGSIDKMLIVPGVIVDYDINTKKATIVGWRAGGMNITVHGVPYDPLMELTTPSAGCWCNFTDLELEPEKSETTSVQ